MSTKSSKIVAGSTKQQISRDTTGAAIRGMLTPDYVTGWVKWFDETPCDRLGKNCEECKACEDAVECANAAAEKGVWFEGIGASERETLRMATGDAIELMKRGAAIKAIHLLEALRTDLA